jgi:hypothetical protein
MREVWLQANRRVLLLSLVPVGALAAIGGALLAFAEATPVRVVAWILVGMSGLLLVGLIDQLRRPRIAYEGAHVLFNLGTGRPVPVPVEVVEAFFLGQGSAHLPAFGGQPAETVNLVARLSQKAPQFAHRAVKPALGAWCDGYVTIRGTWCERLDNEVVRRLNRRLREIHDSLQAAQSAARAE